MSNSEKIIQYLVNNQATVNDIAEYLGISRQAVHRILNNLVAEGNVAKAGKPPKVYYSVSKQATRSTSITSKAFIIDNETKKIIDENFLFITPFGQKLIGWDGFTNWCSERKQDIAKMTKLYVQTIKKYDSFKKDGLVNGMKKIKTTFTDVALDEVFYLDFYNVEIFGKTKLGQLLLFAKQSQDITLMNQLIDSIKPSVLDVIEKFKIDGVAFIPPTVKREHQLMKQLQRRLNLDTRIISLVKIKTPVIIPQKTLNKLDDRIINARETIVVDDNGKYSNILILDDAIGSGSTLNEVAKKIKQKGICDGKIIGIAITGSSNGFDVISEV
jgi:DNA-binding Lrp family transcriptional regulator